MGLAKSGKTLFHQKYFVYTFLIHIFRVGLYLRNILDHKHCKNLKFRRFRYSKC